MNCSNAARLKVPPIWKELLAKKDLDGDEKDDCRTINGKICDGIEFTLYLNSDERHYWLDVTIDDSLNGVFYDSEGSAAFAIDKDLIVETEGHVYTIRLSLAD